MTRARRDRIVLYRWRDERTVNEPDVKVAGIRITHPHRVVFPAIGFTKLDLARFYERLAERILPHLVGRPLTLLRCPDGAGPSCAFMRHSKVWTWTPLRRVRIQEKHKIGEYLVAEDLRGLIALVQMDILEIHTWNSTIDAIEQPNRLVIDLDPGPTVAWSEVVTAARRLRALLAALDLESFVKTTGGDGLHVVVPLRPAHDWRECLAFARAVAEALVASDPVRYTTALPKAGRERKILLDVLRNNRTNTSVAAFSTRARPHGPLSVPVAWEDLSSLRGSDRYDVRNLGRRLARARDPWSGYWTSAQTIPDGALEALRRVTVPAAGGD
jgi:bifunctional non-homologous end joining protein LigD